MDDMTKCKLNENNEMKIQTKEEFNTNKCN